MEVGGSNERKKRKAGIYHVDDGGDGEQEPGREGPHFVMEPTHERNHDQSARDEPTKSLYQGSGLGVGEQQELQGSKLPRHAVVVTATMVIVPLVLIAALVILDVEVGFVKTQSKALGHGVEVEVDTGLGIKAMGNGSVGDDHETATMGVNPRIPGLHFVTYSNWICRHTRYCAFCPLIRSAYCAGVRVWVLGQGHSALIDYIAGCRQKLVDTHKFLKDRSKHGLKDQDMMCFLDGHDTLVLRSLHDFESKIRELMRPRYLRVVFNPEIGDSSLNSGVYCGEVADVFKILDEVMRDTFITYPDRPDQQLIRMLLNYRSPEFRWVGVDINHSLLANNVAKNYVPSFCPLSLLTEEELDAFVAANGVEGLPRGNETGNFPYIMHHAGKNKGKYISCRQRSCPGAAALYYDVDNHEEKSCLPMEEPAPAAINPS